jgi:hypothetical protein
MHRPRWLKFLDWMELRGIESSEVGRYDGIGLAHVRWRDDSRELFRETIEASLRLIQERDPRRYKRVKRHLKWIVNGVYNTSGACYDHAIRACKLEFHDFREISYEIHVACYARIIVHEATHGVIESHGLAYDEKNRVQIERICVAEQNRFAAKLVALDPERYPARLVMSEFDETHWIPEWTATRRGRLRALWRRWLADRKAEPGPPP